MKLNKRGLELSVNALVVIILGTLILGGGFAIVKGIVDTGVDTVHSVDRQTSAEIDLLLSQGQLVAIPHNNPSGTYGTYTFGVGILNKLADTHAFKIVIIPVHIIQSDGDISTPSWLADTLILDDAPVVLEPNEKKTNIAVGINIPRGSPQGTYEYKVETYYDQELDNNPDDEYAPFRIVRITVR